MQDNHSKLLDFFNGLGEYILIPKVPERHLPNNVAPRAIINDVIDEMNSKIIKRHKRITKNWILPQNNERESRCTKACTAVSFTNFNQDGTNITHFIWFMRNYQEHWRHKKVQVRAAALFYNTELNLKTKIEESNQTKPTYFYRYITEVYPLMFVKIFKIAKKHLSRYDSMDLLFARVSAHLERSLGREHLNKLIGM